MNSISILVLQKLIIQHLYTTHNTSKMLHFCHFSDTTLHFYVFYKGKYVKIRTFV